ncbi:MAG TPA: hypothetical protein VFX16_06035, partial [Pseudonocardiaceae bacterium]|nr:hypothetical protein [Pseudonocardiaceae bacterium]
VPYFEDCARRAAVLLARDPATVLVLGCEISLFCAGFVPGAHLLDRIQGAMNPASWAGFTPAADFTTVQRDVVAMARKHFGGSISYASGEWEDIDWSLFDFVGVDLYRSAANAATFDQLVSGYLKHGKPVVITEFGCCTYQGAQDAGGMGWAIVDYAAEPRCLTGEYVRDESVQVSYFTELLDVFEPAGVHGAFWFTFAGYESPYDPDPRLDLDMASYGVVKIHKGGPWEPKQLWHAMARRYDRAAQ